MKLKFFLQILWRRFTRKIGRNHRLEELEAWYEKEYCKPLVKKEPTCGIFKTRSGPLTLTGDAVIVGSSDRLIFSEPYKREMISQYCENCLHIKVENPDVFKVRDKYAVVVNDTGWIVDDKLMDKVLA